MKYLLNKNKFVAYDSLHESMLYFSTKFRERLKNIDSPISDELLKSEFTDIKPDMTFIDSDKDSEGFITFTQIKNADKKFKKEFQDNDIDLITGKGLNKSLLNFLSNLHDTKLNKSNPFVQSRNKSKIGRFINKTFPNKFKDSEVEDFVNKFKSKFNKGDRFEVVDGKKILEYYLCGNYASLGGTLDSCMSSAEAQNYIKWYADNPKSVNMLVYLDEDDLVKGRALLWNISNPKDFNVFMDRIYYSEDHLKHKFLEYAKENGYAYRQSQSFLGGSEIIFNGQIDYTQYYVKMNGNPNKYPYLDTFKYYNSREHILSNKPGDHNMVLVDDQGGPQTQNTVYSNFHNREIPEDESVWSDYLSDYMLDNEAILSKYHSSFIPMVNSVYSDYLDDDLVKDESVYSNYYGSYLPEDESTLVYDVPVDHEKPKGETQKDYLPNSEEIKIGIRQNGQKIIQNDFVRSDLPKDATFFKSEHNDKYYFVTNLVEDIHGNLQTSKHVSEGIDLDDLEVYEIFGEDRWFDYITKDLAICFNDIYNTDIFDIPKIEKILDDLNADILKKDNLYGDIFRSKDSKINVFDWTEKIYNSDKNSHKRVYNNIKTYPYFGLNILPPLSKKMKEDRLTKLYGTNKEEIYETLKKSINKLVKKDKFKKEYDDFISSDTYKDVNLPDLKEIKSDFLFIIKTHSKEPNASKGNDLFLETFNIISEKKYTWEQLSFVSALFLISISYGLFYIRGIKHKNNGIYEHTVDGIYKYLNNI